jgi:DNA-binding NarL/FixJ family response regulator
MSERRVRRVLIVDDHPVVRQGLRHVLKDEVDLDVCGEADTLSNTRVAISELNPDVLICDISVSRCDGIESVRQLRAHHSRLPILVLSTHDEAIYAERMLSLGVSGYIMKQAPTELFLVALRRVLDGGIYVSEALGDKMLRRSAAGDSYLSADPLDRLTNRESQILQLIATGMSTREAAFSLQLSIKTVESHRERIKRKLNLSSGSQLMRYAVANRQREALPA